MQLAETIKQSVDIVKVIGEYVRLKKAGPSPRYSGLCPFHQEKTPSFSVHSTHQFYKCFGCGAGGDVFKFVQEIEGISFWEALKLIAERNGIPLPQRQEYSDPDSKLRAALLEMHSMAARIYHQSLMSPAGAEARQYFQSRGLTPETIEQFQLGIATREGNTLVRYFQKEGFTAEMMEKSGLVLRRQDGSGLYDNFRSRLMFPIQNESGKVIAFGGRVFGSDDPRKYLNSPETDLYKKSFVLYNLNRAREAARKTGRFILVEGYMDAIALWQYGFGEAVAPCGTSLVNSQVRSMKRHAERVLVNFDPDPGGARGAERSIQLLLEEDMHVRILEFAEDLDPDEYLAKYGAEDYQSKAEAAPGYFYWLADRARTKFDMRSGEGRTDALEFLLPAIQRIPDKIERVAIANDVAGYLGVEQGLVLDYFRKAAGDRKDGPRPKIPTSSLPQNETILLQILLMSEGARQQIVPQLAESGVVATLRGRKVFEALLATANSGEFSYPDFQARLEENDRNLMAALVFADQVGEEAALVKTAQSCVAELEAAIHRTSVSDLKLRIKAAERAGNMAQALALMQELQHLGKGAEDSAPSPDW